MSEAPSKPLPSSTILLLRDGDSGLEVFMVKRHHQIDFASGALVFPGGKLTQGDADPALKALSTGSEGLSDEALHYRVGGIREAFEECGVLLARDKGSQAMLSGERTAAISGRHCAALLDGSTSMADLARAENLTLAVDALVPFAHWITPVGMPKRFDTHFFLAPVPPAQAAAHDGSESVDSVWVTPAEAIAEADAGRMTLVFATRLNVLKLGRAKTVAEAIANARAERVVTVLPEVAKTADGRVLRIPAEAGYGGAEFKAEGIPRP